MVGEVSRRIKRWTSRVPEFELTAALSEINDMLCLCRSLPTPIAEICGPSARPRWPGRGGGPLYPKSLRRGLHSGARLVGPPRGPDRVSGPPDPKPVARGFASWARLVGPLHEPSPTERVDLRLRNR